MGEDISGKACSRAIPLDRLTYTVLDVETTGLKPQGNGITDICCLRVVGGKVVDRFATLVNPGCPIPAFIQEMTGITDKMVQDAPRFHEVAPGLLTFLGDSVLVAHNAPFDLSFLNYGLYANGYRNLANPVVDTMRLARKLIPELRRANLDSVAQQLGVTIEQRHRARGDAEATMEILLKLLSLCAAQGVDNDVKLAAFIAPRRPMSRMRILATNAERERLNVLAERCRALPDAPGVYLMRSSSGRVLYVGKAVSLRKRLASYFSARVSAKTRRLLRQTESIEHVQLGSELEALLEESRLIKLHQSPFNVLLRSYHNYPFIKLDEQGMYPRLVVTREVQDDEAIYFGPFKSVRATEQTVEILSRCFRLYDGRCPERASGSSCLYQQMRRCLAPCLGPEYLVKHRKAVEDVCRLLETDPEGLVEELTRRMDDAAGRLDFEAAALYRDGIDALKVAVARKRLLAPAIEGLNVLAICPSVYPDWVEAFVFGRGRLLDRGRLFVGDGGPDRSAVADFLNEVVIGRAKQGGPITNRIDAQGLDQVNIISKWLDHHGSAATSITLEPLWVEDRFSDVMERVAQAARVAARTRVL